MKQYIFSRQLLRSIMMILMMEWMGSAWTQTLIEQELYTTSCSMTEPQPFACHVIQAHLLREPQAKFSIICRDKKLTSLPYQEST